MRLKGLDIAMGIGTALIMVEHAKGRGLTSDA